ncbi:MAG: PilZ domain-containing protein, partial [Desulfobulbaceae bacterium]|nr:PilZ domain-containing protein [Desulfobulbaceae bacterium]
KNVPLRVIFRDAAHKWNHFDVKVVGNNIDSLYVSVPQTLYRLERRSHYRVPAPSGTVISFTCDHARYETGILNDISAGGMMVSIPGAKQVEGKQLNDIDIALPLTEDDIQYIHIKKGTIVRYKQDAGSKQAAIGVAFQITSKEEESLLQVVRQQELSLLQEQRQNAPQ